MASENNPWNVLISSRRMLHSTACKISAAAGVLNRGCTHASQRKNRPSRAAAKGIRAPVNDDPIKVLPYPTARTAEKIVAAIGGALVSMAATAGRLAWAIATAGNTNWIAALVSMYSTPTMATPAMRATGNDRLGFLISPAVCVTSDHPS